MKEKVNSPAKSVSMICFPGSGMDLGMSFCAKRANGPETRKSCFCWFREALGVNVVSRQAQSQCQQWIRQS